MSLQSPVGPPVDYVVTVATLPASDTIASAGRRRVMAITAGSRASHRKIANPPAASPTEPLTGASTAGVRTLGSNNDRQPPTSMRRRNRAPPGRSDANRTGRTHRQRLRDTACKGQHQAPTPVPSIPPTSRHSSAARKMKGDRYRASQRRKSSEAATQVASRVPLVMSRTR
jgi:hypothetical protein